MEGQIAAVILAIPMVLASLDLSAGGRLFAAAILTSATWAVILGGIIVSHDSGTHADHLPCI